MFPACAQVDSSGPSIGCTRGGTLERVSTLTSED
jgi:hypothetical protein